MLSSLQDSLQEMNEACQAYASNLTAIVFLTALALVRTGFPLVLLNAWRVSLRCKQRVQAKQVETGAPEVKTTFLPSLFATLVMGLGGPTTAQLLLGIGPTEILSTFPIMTYAFVYSAVTLTLKLLPFLAKLVPYLELPLLAIAALVNGRRIAVLVQLSQNLGYHHSSFVHAILGMLTVNAGDQLISMFALDEAKWRFQKPPCLKPMGFLESLDLWSAAIAACLCGFFSPVQPIQVRWYQQVTGNGALTKPSAGAILSIAACLWICYSSRYFWRVFRNSRSVLGGKPRARKGCVESLGHQQKLQADDDAEMKKGQ